MQGKILPCTFNLLPYRKPVSTSTNVDASAATAAATALLKNLYEASQQLATDPKAYLSSLGVKILNTHDAMQMPQQWISPAVAALNIPTDFDARVRWPNCKTLQEIRMQGGCGACWVMKTAYFNEIISQHLRQKINRKKHDALLGKCFFNGGQRDLASCLISFQSHTVVESLSDRLCIFSPKQDLNVHLSAQDLLTCCDSCATCGSGWYVEWKGTKNLIIVGYFKCGFCSFRKQIIRGLGSFRHAFLQWALFVCRKHQGRVTDFLSINISTMFENKKFSLKDHF